MSAKPSSSRHSRQMLRASEVGEYVYCARAWWLRAVAGQASINTRELAHGTTRHALHGRGVAASRYLLWLALALGLMALVLFAFAR